jgi:hypothetical protein
MDAWLDTLAKDSANGLSRRQIFGRVAGGFGFAVLAVCGLRPRANDCGKLCEECCRNNYPHGGADFGACVSSCHQGQGVCGPIVCPQ